MNILLAASEVAPLAKTGGLADVAGALPRALAELGHRVAVIMPHYPRCFDRSLPRRATGASLTIPIAQKTVQGEILESLLPDSTVPVYLVDQPAYYDRDELYRKDGRNYKDNCERFVFFSRAVLEAVRALDLEVDCIHANDWQMGLVPAYLEIEYRRRERFAPIASVFTVHNLAYQGEFWHWDMLLTGLDWKYFNWQQMEFHGHLNLLKTGLVFADVVTTVSRRYAEEIQTEEFGCGLEGVLRTRADDLYGILNGIDYEEWNPATDPHLAANYDRKNYADGKAQCKAALQRESRLPREPRVPLIGMISRLADQKGLDLVADAAERILSGNVQLVVLGTGEPKYHKLMKDLSARYPKKVAAYLTFDNALAHRVEAGADLFLMPSQYEPCGLNQMYSLRYGTVPVVRATGGLADTIVDANPTTLAAGEANGFSFEQYTAAALESTLGRALTAYRDAGLWKQLIETAMAQDWSWRRSARDYAQAYEKAAMKHTAAVFS